MTKRTEAFLRVAFEYGRLHALNGARLRGAARFAGAEGADAVTLGVEFVTADMAALATGREGHGTHHNRDKCQFMAYPGVCWDNKYK
jgi:hypothetical protein